MRRSLLVAAVLGLTATAAPAQYFYGRQNYGFNYNPLGINNGAGFSYGGFNWTYFQTRQFSYSFNNPILGYSGAYDFRFNFYGPQPPYGYGGVALNPYAQAAYLSGGVGAYVPGMNPIIQQQQQLLAGAQPNRPAAGDANRLIADQARLEFGRPAAAPAAAVELDQALVEPTDAAINSGDALNALHAAIRPLMAKKKGEPPVFPTEVLGHLRFDGPAAGTVAGWVRAGKPEVPAALAGPAFDALRADIEKPTAELLQDAAEGRRNDGPAAERLRAAIQTLRSAHAEQFRSLGLDDAAAVSRYLTALIALADAGRDGGLLGFYPAKWAAGASAADLLSHMDRLKVRFGPAAPDDAEAYTAVHRGLLAYLASLQPKR